MVTGAGGFLGAHLVGSLLRAGHRDVLAVDRKPLDRWSLVHDGVENRVADLSHREACDRVCTGAERVYHLAASDGGAGFAATHETDRMLSALIDGHLLLAARAAAVERFFLASSLGAPEGKRFSEALCRRLVAESGMRIRVLRLPSVYGPLSPWMGGRERAPAALCRKAVEAKLSGDPRLEIWGDGSQTRTLVYVDDAVEAALRVAQSDVAEPLALGARERVPIGALVSCLAEICGVALEPHPVPGAPTGPADLGCDGSELVEHLGWEPRTPLREGLERTYKWIHDEYLRRWGGRLGPREPSAAPAAAPGEAAGS